ncbi:MAG: hypothetical protein ABIO05_00460, partial [Ferruginibacter sp.]
KELLTYLLFYNNNENSYVADIKESLHLLFTDVNVKSYFITKKNLRKILRLSNKFIRYSPNLATEVDILIYIADEILQLNLNLSKSAALQNLYNNLIKRIEKKINDLHEDLQYDFNKQLFLLIPQKK